MKRLALFLSLTTVVFSQSSGVGSNWTTVTGTLQSAAVANGNGSVLAVQGLSTALITVNCTVACSGGTAVTFQIEDSAGNFFPVIGQQVGFPASANTQSQGVLSSTIINQGTAPTTWSVNIAGAQAIRSPISAYSAGTITVTAMAIAGSYAPNAVTLASTPTPSTVPVQIQKNSLTGSGSVASLQPAFLNANTAGNSIVIACGIGNGTTATVTDSNSNTYALVINEPNSTAFSSQIFLAVNIKAGANTVTVTPSSSTSVDCAIKEYSGFITATNVAGGTSLAAGVAIDQTNGGIATGTAVTSGPIGTIVPNEYVEVAVSVGTGTSTFGTVTPGFNTDYSANTGGTPSGVFSFLSGSAYLAVSESINAAVTLGTSRPWAAAIASFKSIVLPVQSVGPTTSPAVGISVCNQTAVTTAVACKTTPGNMYAWALGNANANVCYLQVFNTSSVTLGTTSEIMDIVIPGATTGGGNNLTLPFPVSFSTAIYVASTTLPHGSVTTGCSINASLFYQ